MVRRKGLEAFIRMAMSQFSVNELEPLSLALDLLAGIQNDRRHAMEMLFPQAKKTVFERRKRLQFYEEEDEEVAGLERRYKRSLAKFEEEFSTE